MADLQRCGLPPAPKLDVVVNFQDWPGGEKEWNSLANSTDGRPSRRQANRCTKDLQRFKTADAAKPHVGGVGGSRCAIRASTRCSGFRTAVNKKRTYEKYTFSRFFFFGRLIRGRDPRQGK